VAGKTSFPEQWSFAISNTNARANDVCNERASDCKLGFHEW